MRAKSAYDGASFEALTMPDGPTPQGPDYDDDFYAWTQHQAAVLRAMPVTDNRFDRENVAEEIETLGRSERDAVRSQVRRIIEHFLKLQFSPVQEPPYGWMRSITDARAQLGDKLSTTLRRDAESALATVSDDARGRTGHPVRVESALPDGICA